MSRRWIVLLMSLQGANSVVAQTVVRDGLEIPETVSVCRVVPRLPDHPGLRAVEMAEGAVGQSMGRRSFVVQFDSLEQAAALAVFGDDSLPDGREQSYGIAVEFGKPEQSFRIMMTDAAAGAPRDSTSIKERLTEAQLVRALALARWLLKHRCGRTSGEERRWLA